MRILFYNIENVLFFFLLDFRDRLIANDFIQIRKVIEHVYEKVLGVLDNNAYSSASGVNGVGASTPAGSAPTPTGPSPSAGSAGLNQPSGSNTTVVTPNSEKGLPGSAVSSTTVDRQETGSIAEEKVELLCNEQVTFEKKKYQYHLIISQGLPTRRGG